MLILKKNSNKKKQKLKKRATNLCNISEKKQKKTIEISVNKRIGHQLQL